MSSNFTNTTVYVGSVALRDCLHQDEELTFGGAGTVLEGTILARSTSTGKLIPYVKGGSSDGDGVPRAVLPYTVEATGAGDVPVRPIISGVVNVAKLVIHADGDAENIDGAVRDLLRATGIIPVDVNDLGRVDNPQPEPLDS